MDLTVQLAPVNRKDLLLANPVMAASGTCGYGTEYSELTDIRELGAIICKGTTLQPWEGNPQPRIVETASGMLNSVGLQNIGVDALIRDKAPLWAQWQVPVIVNIAGESIDEYARIAEKLDGVAGIAGIEINISCPNLSAGGMEFGVSPVSAAQVTSAVREKTGLPVIVKLSPNVTDIVEIAVAVSKSGADALTLINTLRGMVIDIGSKKPLLGNVFGGLSGPAIKPVALYMVYRVARAVNIPVIGCGGIDSAEDALEFIMAGASAVQVGTANMVDPEAAPRVLEGIRQYMEKQHIDTLKEIIGIAQV
jgi:dihydroorotate dehydrogenase (NAD+) catalytic subunit